MMKISFILSPLGVAMQNNNIFIVDLKQACLLQAGLFSEKSVFVPGQRAISRDSLLGEGALSR